MTAIPVPDGALIVSVSGIRGIVGQGLTAEKALAFASALGSHLSGGAVALSRDGRPSGAMLRHAVHAGFLQTGCTVHDLGIVSTPTCGLAIRRLCARGGMQITASHNPAEWNGLKLFSSHGAVLTAAEGKIVKERFDAGSFANVAWDRLGTVLPCTTASDWHRDRVLELVDVAAIRKRGFSVFLDANGGAGGPLGRSLLEALGCRVTVEGGDADGRFRHAPEPLADNLASVLPCVSLARADLGLVLDPDADRLAIIDETGRYIGEELTLALAVSLRLRQQPGPVVINMSTSRLIEDLASSFGVPCERSAVGEANVVEKMQATGAVIGGEGNGGVIDPRVGLVRDPFIGMALVLELLACTGKKLSDLVADLPAYHIVKDKHTVSAARLPQVNAALAKHWPDARASHLDGLRLDWPDRWVHVRGSNTEPIVRVIAEARTAAEAQQLCGQVGATISAS
ncbi:MAG: phosphoglucosamine mutase [Planctomycetes bacterium]|nr:phosphoglucosamine mutase [Planctomycetota bacterium]